MNQHRDPKPTGGLDLLLICVAATLGLVCIPMIFEFSGGSGRALLFACMLLPPMEALSRGLFIVCILDLEKVKNAGIGFVWGQIQLI